MARDYSLSVTLPGPEVPVVDLSTGRMTEEWRRSEENVYEALFPQGGDVLLTVPSGSYVGSVTGGGNGLTIAGTPGAAYVVTLTLARNIITDGTKLDSIEAGATADQTAAEIRSLVESATDSNVFTDADHTKLNGIATGATANATDAALRDRATHTGAQAISTVTGLQTALDGKAATSHTHSTANITGLDAALASKVSKTAAITNANAAHTEPTSFAETKTALDALGAKINEVIAALNA